MIAAYRELWSLHRSRLIAFASTTLLAGQVFLADLDFDTVGLVKAGGADLAKWAFLAPFLLVPPLVLPVVSRSLPRALARSPQGWMTLWLAWSLATILWSLSPRQTLLQGLGIVGLWLTAVWFVTVFGWRRFAVITVATATVFLALGLLVDLGSGNLSLAGEQRFSGLTFGPTNLARYSTLTLLLAATLWRVDSRAHRLATVAIPLAAVVLIGTNTRTALLAVFLAWLVVLGRRRGARTVLAVVAVCIALGMAFVSLGGASSQALSRTDDPADIGSFNGRTTIWPIAIDLIQQNPVQGYGTATSEDLWVEAAKEGEIWWYAYNSHNIFTELALAHGIPGLVFFLTGLAAFFRRWRRWDTPWHDGLVVAILAGGMTEAVINRPSLTVIALAAVFAQRGIPLDEGTPTPEPTGRHLVDA
jgi:O-antigen ligase